MKSCGFQNVFGYLDDFLVFEPTENDSENEIKIG